MIGAALFSARASATASIGMVLLQLQSLSVLSSSAMCDRGIVSGPAIVAALGVRPGRQVWKDRIARPHRPPVRPPAATPAAAPAATPARVPAPPPHPPPSPRPPPPPPPRPQ